MQKAAEYLRLALRILEAQRFDAKVRYDKYAHRQRGHSSGAARQAKAEYQTCDDMIDYIQRAIDVASDFE